MARWLVTFQMADGSFECVHVDKASDETTANIFACEDMIGRERVYKRISSTMRLPEMLRGVIGSGKTVHRVNYWPDTDQVSAPLCGAGVHSRKFCGTSRTRLVRAPLTCKKCIAAEELALVKSS